MKGFALKYTFFILFLVFGGCNAFAEQLKIGISEWRGYTNADGTGIYFDLLKKTYPQHTFIIKPDSYNRTIANFNKGELDLIVGIYREDIAEGILPHWHLDTEAPITAYYADKTLNIERLADLKNLTVSWIRGYRFDNFIPYVKTPYLVNDVQTGFELLEKGRIDVFIDFPYNLPTKNQTTLISFEIMPPRHIYIGFQHNKFGALLSQQWDSAMLKLRESGELAKIFSDVYINSELDTFNPNKQTFIIKTSTVALENDKEAQQTETIERSVLNLIVEKNEQYNIELTYGELDLTISNKEQNICFSNKLKTAKRLETFIFSKPMTMYMGQRLYSKTVLNLTEPIALPLLLKTEPSKSLGVVEGRSYSQNIDHTLQTLPSKQVVRLSKNTNTYFKMFNGKRVDYIIEYPSIIADYWKTLNVESPYSYSIDGANEYNIGYIMCNNTTDGKEFIKAINKALTALYKTKRFSDILHSELDKYSKDKFYQYFDEVFKINK